MRHASFNLCRNIGGRVVRSILLAAFLALLPAVVLAQGLDPHRIYERKCSGCHEDHAGDFVAANIDYVDGRAIWRASGRPVEAFLSRKHGKLTPSERKVLVDHLNKVAEMGGLYREKCLICHDRAVVLARSRLIIRADKLTGRYSKRDIADFLKTHGRLSLEEAERMTATLRRQLPSSLP
ncbi:hypothetical protein [Roseibium sp.]|uniref:hypothetical protein n=1 Tax=Roseibium sp. TaxID=1936156 RepID=UPI003A979AD0